MCISSSLYTNPMYITYNSGEAWLQAMALCVPASTLSGLAGLGISGPELFTNMSTLRSTTWWNFYESCSGNYIRIFSLSVNFSLHGIKMNVLM